MMENINASRSLPRIDRFRHLRAHYDAAMDSVFSKEDPELPEKRQMLKDLDISKNPHIYSLNEMKVYRGF